eukprot:jgi/Botrbrau1/8185/Bobra.357_2s0028.1
MKVCFWPPLCAPTYTPCGTPKRSHGHLLTNTTVRFKHSHNATAVVLPVQLGILYYRQGLLHCN